MNADSGAHQTCAWAGLAAPQSYATGASPAAVAVGDLNHDGQMDLVVANWVGPLLTPSGSVSVYLNQGSGAFAAQTTYPTDMELEGLGLGDFNGDGYADVTVGDALGFMNVLLNAGDGTLEPFVHYTDVNAGDDSLAVADFDGDGHPDIALASDLRTVRVHFGNGDGSFGSPVSDATGNMPYSMSPIDVNGDGHVDLVLTNVDFPPGRGLPVGLGAGSVNVLVNRVTARSRRR